jgi:hypothetical protein
MPNNVLKLPSNRSARAIRKDVNKWYSVLFMMYNRSGYYPIGSPISAFMSVLKLGEE